MKGLTVAAASTLLVAVAVLAGCVDLRTGDPRNAVITKDNRYKALDDVGLQLSDDERRDLVWAHTRAIFGKYSIEGKTVNQVLSEQKQFDDEKTAPLLGSWRCAFQDHGLVNRNVHVAFTFNPNHTETVRFTGPKPQPHLEHYHFGFNGSTLEEEAQWGYYLDSVGLSGGAITIKRAVQKSNSNADGGGVPWPDVFTCGRAPRRVGANGF